MESFNLFLKRIDKWKNDREIKAEEKLVKTETLLDAKLASQTVQDRVNEKKRLLHTKR